MSSIEERELARMNEEISMLKAIIEEFTGTKPRPNTSKNLRVV